VHLSVSTEVKQFENNLMAPWTIWAGWPQ